MHKVLILACCAVSISFSSARFLNITQKLDLPVNKSETLLKTIAEKISTTTPNKINGSKQNEKISNTNHANTTEKADKTFTLRGNRNSKDEKTFPILYKIHERITRSKDAVWAAITLTFMCILLVLAVAQSRMWKDPYYSETQGVPLPNFNERVLFKDVMEHKIATLKQFFKKKSKNKNVTELESLLPPSEWDN